MKVMVIVKASKASEAGEMPSEQLLRDMGNFNEELVNAGVMLAGEGLHPSSAGVRVRFSGKNRSVIDGPFAETKELIAGFWLWKVKSMEEAIEWVKRCPNPMTEDSEIEVRRVFDAADFGAEFTPELREQEATIRAQTLGLLPPRFEDGIERKVVGLNETYTMETRVKIPSQWQRFAPHIGSVPGQLDDTSSYGVCWNSRPNNDFDYLTGVAVTETVSLPENFVSVVLPAKRYVVFTHNEHVSTFPKTIDMIWSQWVPDCGLKVANGPCFELYSEEFDPQTGMGGMELWIPIA